ncbi:hypothetical protein LWE61_11110 [Sphingobium sufflavum]|uniref:hypothetical protein n=1 Tax=Sphingobium sufflavum TaxID=1129547 RepID=UPI001F26EEB9|nr:hypothetical protein [Sphingobium sufflavum]MCE7797106.1 hypothetical protein [Sphingobium sufflavum]
MTDESPLDPISQMVAKLPDWLRHDLAAKDKKSRERAEEALSAMIAATIAGTSG